MKRMIRLLPASVVVAVILVVPGAASAQCAATAQAFIADGKYDQARADVQAQLKRAPTDDRAMECMGRVRLEQNESAEAVEWLEKAVAINAKSGTHHLWLANAIRGETERAGILRQMMLARRMKADESAERIAASIAWESAGLRVCTLL